MSGSTWTIVFPSRTQLQCSVIYIMQFRAMRDILTLLQERKKKNKKEERKKYSLVHSWTWYTATNRKYELFMQLRQNTICQNGLVCEVVFDWNVELKHCDVTVWTKHKTLSSLSGKRYLLRQDTILPWTYFTCKIIIIAKISKNRLKSVATVNLSTLRYRIC